MEIQGRIKTIFATETVGQNGFQKRDLVITTDGQYPQDIIIQFAQGNCAVLDRFQVGQIVKIHFNLQGREWTSPQGEVKYFNTSSLCNISKPHKGTYSSRNMRNQPTHHKGNRNISRRKCLTITDKHLHKGTAYRIKENKSKWRNWETLHQLGKLGHVRVVRSLWL